MIDMQAVGGALTLLFSSWEPWLVVPPGLFIGLLFAAIPGISISIAMALFLPFTLHMDFLPAVLFLSSIYTGGGFGGAIPAILINIPGTPAATATTFDGYPMARKGLHNEAMGLALGASALGSLIGYVLLMLVIQPMVGWVLALGPAEMLMIGVWGLTLIAVLREKHVTRGLLAGVLGLLVGSIGMSLRGDIRGTGGSFYLLDGIPAIPALIGLFAASQLFDLLDSRYIVEDKEKRTISLGRILWGVWQTVRHFGILIRGSIIGIVIGALPGVGAAVACLISYAETKRTAKDPESFGTGDPRGIVAAESADSSAEGGSMAPLLALGIPGGSGTAILMGAFAMHNITGGPRFIAERLDLVYAIIISNFAQASLLLVMGIGFIYACSAVVKVPVRVLMPTVMATAVLGSYTITENMVGPVTVLVCAVIGWALRRYDYPVANVVIGLLLARMVEGESLRTWQLSGGQFFDFLSTRPTAMVLAALLVASLVWPMIRQRLRKA